MMVAQEMLEVTRNMAVSTHIPKQGCGVDKRFKQAVEIWNLDADAGGEDIGALYNDQKSGLKFVVLGGVYRTDVSEGNALKEILVRYVSDVLIAKEPLPENGVVQNEKALLNKLRVPKNAKECQIANLLVSEIAHESKNSGAVFHDRRRPVKGRLRPELTALANI